MPFQDSSIQAIVSLLTDDNPKVYAETRKALRYLGERAVPFLETAESSEDALLRSRARAVHEELRVHILTLDIEKNASGLDEDASALERCCILLARSRYPSLESSTIPAALDAMADDLETRIQSMTSSLARAKALSRFLAGELGFQGNQRNYFDPENSYLNRVLERRTGIPITLSAIYLLVGRRLGLPIHGIGLPGHFILRFGEQDPWIFIDAFHSGRLMTETDCRRHLRSQGHYWRSHRMEPMSDGAIFLRMLRNLQMIYRNSADAFQAETVRRLHEAVLREGASEQGPGAGAGDESVRG